MTGTSADQVDAVLIDIVDHQPQFVDSHSLAMGASLQTRIHALCGGTSVDLREMLQVEQTLADLVVQSVTALLLKTKLKCEDIDALGVHGQTIAHWPGAPNGLTYQLGDIGRIAMGTNIPTVGDFRRQDMALGGQGAPLVPIFQRALTPEHSPWAFLNLGGIANITIFSHDADIIGYDVGPGNVLIDSWIQLHQGLPYDDLGVWARSGVCNQGLLQTMLGDAYFHKTWPKSTGREYFNMSWVEKHMQSYPDIKMQDVQATLTELTAKSIVKALQNHPSVEKLWLFGGGCHNQHLLSAIERGCKGLVCERTEGLGFPVQTLEGAAFAYLAWCRLHNRPGNLSSVTGARRPAILGGLYEARQDV